MSEPARVHRLSVNINDECAAALRYLSEHHDMSITEAIRRAIALLAYHEAAKESRDADR